MNLSVTATLGQNFLTVVQTWSLYGDFRRDKNILADVERWPVGAGSTVANELCNWAFMEFVGKEGKQI